MLTEALATLAVSGGTAVVQAAGQDAWDGLRSQLARWFGRGDAQREDEELERLSRTAEALRTAPGEEPEQLRSRYAGIWQNRIEDMLESLEGRERAEAAEALRSLLAESERAGLNVSAADGGVAAAGDINMQAGPGSVVAAAIRGNVHVGPVSPPESPPEERPGGPRPQTPAPPQG
ncbi:hypothetical protein ACFYYM_35815 [Streptomyces erythrochromogenes]|uniref:hypothetical protein n=1 Tax=Streptomyces erythrochromogenes TaxID=285574 RepID=UPI0036C55780